MDAAFVLRRPNRCTQPNKLCSRSASAATEALLPSGCFSVVVPSTVIVLHPASKGALLLTGSYFPQQAGALLLFLMINYDILIQTVSSRMPISSLMKPAPAPLQKYKGVKGGKK